MEAEDPQDSGEVPANEAGTNDGKWFKEEHDIFLTGTHIITQHSRSMDVNGS